MFLVFCVVQTINPRKPPKQRECQAGDSNVDDSTVTGSTVSIVATTVSVEPVDHMYHTEDSP